MYKRFFIPTFRSDREDQPLDKETILEQDKQMAMKFASIIDKKVEADFDGGVTTSNGGTMFVRKSE